MLYLLAGLSLVLACFDHTSVKIVNILAVIIILRGQISRTLTPYKRRSLLPAISSNWISLSRNHKNTFT